MTEQRIKSPIMILRKFFGLKQGQTLSEFKAECDELTTEEKQELSELAGKELITQ